MQFVLVRDGYAESVHASLAKNQISRRTINFIFDGITNGQENQKNIVKPESGLTCILNATLILL